MLKKLLTIISVFTLGWFFSSLCTNLITREKPFSASFFSEELSSPHDRIKQDQIKVYNDKVEIMLKNAQLTSYQDTNSMDPLLDKDSHGITIIPSSEKDIHTGDIISYSYGNDIIVHRVVEIGHDKEGWYCIAKGDNNKASDPQKIRFSQIKRVLVGVIY